MRIEDAFAKERYAFEVTVASLKLERSGSGVYRWAGEPELAYGILPRTHVKVGVPMVAIDDESGRQVGIAGVDVAVFHNLNAETRLPALALKASVVVPVGALGPDQIHPAVTLIASRSFKVARVHANAQYTFGKSTDEGDAEGGSHEAARWLAGLAVDKALPLHSMLLIADVYAAQPLSAHESVTWNAEAGLRYQINPSLAIDAGLGKAFRGGDQGWFVTFGSAYAFGLRSLIPVRR